jgi:hypothetical protein
MNSCVPLAAVAILAGSAMGQVSAINGMTSMPRIFNDRPGSNLVITNNYPSSFRIAEDTPGQGGFANWHMGGFSTNGGASPYDFNYNDAFDATTTVTVHTLNPGTVGGEAGFSINLFGRGFFGILPHNGEIAAFGGSLPFFTSGAGTWTGQTTFSLRMIHTPGNGNGLPGGATIPSTIQYLWNLGSGWVSSPVIAFDNLEGGIPDIPGNPAYIGVGVQNNWGAGLVASDFEFTNITIAVPAPGAAAALAGFLLMGAARRRR